MNKYKVLYIIGNGFDIHHGIPSSYANYRTWILENHIDIYEKIMDFYEEDYEKSFEWWSDFENSMGYFDYREKIENIAFENQPSDEELESMRAIDDMRGAWDAEVEIGGIYDKIKETFHEWINSLPRALSARKVHMDNDKAFYINFNYTLTLEKVYNISSDDILHIHGSINNDDYIIGHGRSYFDVQEEAEPYYPPYDEKEDPSEYGLDVSDDIITENTKKAVVEQVMDAAKPVTEIINKNKYLFDRFKEIDKVYIYGFSFSDIDLSYLEEVISSVSPNCKYVISYFSKKDLENATKFGKEHKIIFQLIKLEDIEIKRELKIKFP